MRKIILFIGIMLGFTSWSSAQNGLDFDGNDDFVQTTYNGVLASANRTFEAWIFVSSNAPSSNLAILDYGLNAVGSRNTFSVSGNRQLIFISGGTNANISTAVNEIPVNQWTHVAFVLDNGTGYLYVNGNQKGTGSLTTVNTPSTGEAVKVGNRIIGGSIPFNGSVDEVRIWDIARTTADIQADMNTELCGQHPNLKLYLKLNEGTAGGSNAGITATADNSGNGNNGTLNNFSLTGTTSNWINGSGVSTGNSSTSSIQQSACDSFSLTANSTVYTTSGIYTEVLLGANAIGCDSIVTIDLTINNTASTDVQIACNSYTWIDGNTYTANNNMATFTLTNVAGCDSVVTLDLTISNTSTTDVQTACDSYTWTDGNTYTSSNNTATQTLTNIAGCDSIITLDLTISNSSSSTFSKTICDSYTWIDGNTYTSSNNTATYTLTNATGCDSTITLDLTIKSNSSSTDTQIACDTYTWIDGNTYTSDNNTATYTLTNAIGCDSIITLDLTISTINSAVTQDNALLTADEAGVTYQWVECPAMTVINGATNQSYTATANGNYAVIVTNSQCSDTSACYAVTTVGTSENQFGNSLQLFPNPTYGDFAIDMGEKYNKTTVTITDLTGRLVYSNTYTNQQMLNLKLEKPAGVYLLIIETENKKAVIRLIKK